MIFSTLLVDPPWSYSDQMLDMVSTGNGAASQYDCMSLDSIKRFPRTLSYVVAPDAFLWLWFTNAFAVEAHDVARAYGFEPKTIVTWIKGRIEDNRIVHHIGQGHYLRNSTEHVLFAVRGKKTPDVRYLPTAFIFPGRWPDRLHSEKPRIHKWCELLDKDGTYLELFARRRREGWTQHGRELDHDV